MENQHNFPQSFVETVEEYAGKKIKLVKLQAVQTTSETAATLASGFILLLIVNMALLLLSTGIAIWIGNYTGKMYFGFLITGSFYFIAAIIVFIFRRKWLKHPLQNVLIKKMLS